MFLFSSPVGAVGPARVKPGDRKPGYRNDSINLLVKSWFFVKHFFWARFREGFGFLPRHGRRDYPASGPVLAAKAQEPTLGQTLSLGLDYRLGRKTDRGTKND
jgi:hypothetical protein